MLLFVVTTDVISEFLSDAKFAVVYITHLLDD